MSSSSDNTSSRKSYVREGWLLKRRVDQDRTAAHRVYARLTEDALLWYKSPEEESAGGVLLLGRCAVCHTLYMRHISLVNVVGFTRGF